MSAPLAPSPLDLHVYRISIGRPLFLWCFSGLCILAFSAMAFLGDYWFLTALGIFADCIFAALIIYGIWDYRKSRLEVSSRGVLYRELGIELKATWAEIGDMRVDQWREGFITIQAMEGSGPERFKLKLIGARLPNSSWDEREIQLMSDKRFIPLGLFSHHLRRGNLRGLIVGFAPHLKGALDRIDAPGAGFSIKTMYMILGVSAVLVPAVTVIPALFHVSRAPVERNSPATKGGVKHPDEKGESASLLKQVTALVDQGDALRAQGQFADALKAYRESLALAERTSKRQPNDTSWQLELSMINNRVGDVLRAQGQLADALKAYHESVAISKRVLKQSPGDVGWQSELACSYERVGDVSQQQKQWSEAAAGFELALEIGRPWMARPNLQASWISIFSYCALSRWKVLLDAPQGAVKIDRAEALADLYTARDTMQKAKKTGGDGPPSDGNLASVEELLSAEGSRKP